MLAQTCFAWPLQEAPPLERLLGFYEPLDLGLPLGPAVFFRDARVEDVKPSQYLPTPLGVHRRVPFVPSLWATLRSVFDLALLEESDGLLVKLLLSTRIPTTLEHPANVLTYLLHTHEIKRRTTPPGYKNATIR